MEIKHRSNEYMMLEDIPLVGPVTAYSFIFVGLIPILIINTRFPTYNFPQYKLLGLWGLLFSLVGVFLLFRLKEQNRIILDRSRNALIISRKKPPLGKKIEKTYELSDVREISIETNLEENGQRIVAHLKDGQIIPFTECFNSGQANAYPGICRTLNQYLSFCK